MRADRLLSIVLLLQRHDRLTAAALATRLEVSERTIYRDMDALSAAGVPVYMERGQGGGCVLDRAYRTDLTGLSEAEARTLVLASPPHLLADLGWKGVNESAFVKFVASLPAVSRRNAEIVRERMYVDAATWRQGHDHVPYLALVQEAVWAERVFVFEYERADGTLVTRQVHPLGIVSKGGLWYLVAECAGEMRTYRVSRIRAATVQQEQFVRPASFDLATYWRTSLALFTQRLPRYPVVLQVAPELLPHMQVAGAYAEIAAPSPPDAAVSVMVPIVFETEEDACAYVFRFGAQVTVVSPPALRERVRRTAITVAAQYADG